MLFRVLKGMQMPTSRVVCSEDSLALQDERKCSRASLCVQKRVDKSS